MRQVPVDSLTYLNKVTVAAAWSRVAPVVVLYLIIPPRNGVRVVLSWVQIAAAWVEGRVEVLTIPTSTVRAVQGLMCYRGGSGSRHVRLVQS